MYCVNFLIFLFTLSCSKRINFTTIPKNIQRPHNDYENNFNTKHIFIVLSQNRFNKPSLHDIQKKRKLHTPTY